MQPAPSRALPAIEMGQHRQPNDATVHLSLPRMRSMHAGYYQPQDPRTPLRMREFNGHRVISAENERCHSSGSNSPNMERTTDLSKCREGAVLNYYTCEDLERGHQNGPAIHTNLEEGQIPFRQTPESEIYQTPYTRVMEVELTPTRHSTANIPREQRERRPVETPQSHGKLCAT